MGQPSFCLLNCHLAHGKDNAPQRFEEMKRIFDASFENMDGKSVMAHDVKFMYGDLNFRIDLPISDICQLTREKKFKIMKQNDQLLNTSHQFNFLPNLYENPLKFPPTYKYIVKTSDYNLDKRPPAWCDRILWIENDSIKCHEYNCVNSICVSDHKPIYGVFSVHLKELLLHKKAAMPVYIPDPEDDKSRGFSIDTKLLIGEPCNAKNTDSTFM